MNNRRKFIKGGFTASLGMLLSPGISFASLSDDLVNDPNENNDLKISLAQWSLREWLWDGTITNLDFPVIAKNRFGIEAVEYVSTFFNGKENNDNYLTQLKKQADSEGVQNVLIMVDMNHIEGRLANPEKLIREQAVRNHHKWVDIAKYLGCHAIRVNARGSENIGYDESMKVFIDGLSKLVEYGEKNEMNILVENHGGYSSNGRWLAEVMKQINNQHCGTLPDFGNFVVNREQGIFYDPLVGLSEIVPYAKGLSAKAHQFDNNGNETTIDFSKMINIALTAGFSGYIGIEWGGSGYSNMNPEDGIEYTKELLKKILRLNNQ